MKEKVRGLFDSLGISMALKDHGVSLDHIDSMAKSIVSNPRAGNNISDPSIDDVKRILTTMYGGISS